MYNYVTLSGRAVCSFIDCEHLLGCKNTVTLPKTCCPICKGNVPFRNFGSKNFAPAFLTLNGRVKCRI